MKRTLTGLLLTLALCTPQAYAGDWSRADTQRQIIYTALHVADWRQTRQIARQCGSGEYRELNPVLGPCPSLSRVDNYFLATGLAHYALAYLMPAPQRRYWQTATITLQVAAVGNNAAVGLRIKW